ncbi:MAG TPA: class I adenylate-forming enzyme family protein [Sulfuricurvum sp.]|nr:class I adenylate-forming enzyme family protein [Sulfuricurvum sp.]
MPRVTVISNNGEIGSDTLSFCGYGSENSKKIFLIPDAADKMEQIRTIMEGLQEGNIPLLFDATMRSSDEKARALALSAPQHYSQLDNAAALFFTSGTSGNSIGVVKTRQELMSETAIHVGWLKNETFEQCLVTVPFFHIYGFLFGLSVPCALNLPIVTKEHFLPREILDLCSKKPTLCITNPVFIRAMLRIHEDISLPKSLFICSSGPLEPDEAQRFEAKYSTRLVQLFGSTETGGIALRKGGETLWLPLLDVNVSSDEGILTVHSPFLSRHIFDKEFLPLPFPFRTTDCIETVPNGFKIIGRAAELVKIAGKRLSIVEIERFIETMEGINEALGYVEYHPNTLRGEILTLHLVGEEDKINKSTLKKALHDYFGGIHLECKIVMVEKIEKTSMGKKIRTPLMT